METANAAGGRRIAEIVISSIKGVLSEDFLLKKFRAQKVKEEMKAMHHN